MTNNAIDQNVLNNLLESVGGDLEFLRELIETFFEDSPGQFQAMESALESGDAELFRRAAHSLKSNSASFGALELSKLCKSLEEIGKSGQLDSGKKLLAQAEAAYRETSAALAEYINV